MIFEGKHKEELINYIQQAIGYSLTGDIREQIFFFCYGTGANGKTTLLNTIAALLEDYYKACDFSTLLVKEHNSAVSPDLARMAGARFVTASEPEHGKKLAENTIKQLTGGDRITAAYKFKDHFEFTPVLKLWIAANHKLPIRGQDTGIWRRIRLIPFEVTIPEEKQDKTIPAKLNAELPGILAWAFRGCQDWLKNGLKTPAIVLAETEKYKTESDIIGDFIAEKCVKGKDKKIPVKELYSTYLKWCEENSEKFPLKKKTFSATLLERGGISRPDTKSNNAQTYFGIALQAATKEGEQPSPEPEPEDEFEKMCRDNFGEGEIVD